MSAAARHRAFAIACAAALVAEAPFATPAAAQPPNYRRVDLILADTLGGAVTGVAFDEATSIAYVSRGARVEALDVASDPAGPKLLATSERLAGIARVLGAAGGRAFVAVRNTAGDGTTMEALMVLSTAGVPGAGGGQAALPVVGGIAVSAKIPPSAGEAARVERAFAADASTAYLVAADSPRIVRVIDLRAWPSTSEADVALAADVNGVAIAGGTLFAATDGGVTTVDVTDRNAPVARGALALRWGADGVAVAGATAYATTGDGLASIEIGDPARPALRGPLDEGCAEGAAVVVAGGRVWVARPEQFREPSSVVLCGLEPNGAERPPRRESWSQRGIAGFGKTLLVADGLAGLAAIRPPAAADGGIDTAWRQPTIGDASGIARASGGGAVRVVDSDHEIWSFDAADSAAPRPLGHARVDAPAGIVGSSAGLAVREPNAFLGYLGGVDGGGSMAALDVAAPDRVGVLGTWTTYDVPEERQFDIDSGYSPTSRYGPFLAGNTLYLTGGTVPLTVLDVADPTAPRWLGRFGGTEPFHEAGGLAFDGSRAWIALLDQGVGLLDVADRLAPKLIDQVRLPGYTEDVARDGCCVLAATSGTVRPAGAEGGALVILDAASHEPIAALPSDVPWYRLVVDGTRAYLFGEGVVAIVDVRDPAHPVEVGRVRTGYSNDWSVLPLAVVGDTMWAGTSDLGVSIYRLTEGDAFTPPPPVGPPGTLTPEPPRTPRPTPTVRAEPTSTADPSRPAGARAYLPYGLVERP